MHTTIPLHTTHSCNNFIKVNGALPLSHFYLKNNNKAFFHKKKKRKRVTAKELMALSQRRRAGGVCGSPSLVLASPNEKQLHTAGAEKQSAGFARLAVSLARPAPPPPPAAASRPAQSGASSPRLLSRLHFYITSPLPPPRAPSRTSTRARAHTCGSPDSRRRGRASQPARPPNPNPPRHARGLPWADRAAVGSPRIRS